MKKESISIRINSIMEDRGLRQKDVLDLTKVYSEIYGIKISKSDLSQYCSGKTEPSADKLFILGLALEVNAAWLFGFDTFKEQSNVLNDKSVDIHGELINLINSLSNQQSVTYDGELINEKSKIILETSLKNCINLMEIERKKTKFKTVEQAKIYLKKMNFVAFSGGSNMNDETIIEIANVIYSEKNAKE